MAEATETESSESSTAGRRSSVRRPGNAARRSTARRRTPATGSSRRTTPRSRRISRPRSTRRRPIGRRRPTGRSTTTDGPVVVLDFGSQFAQLIARRVRELDVYSELLPHDTPFAELERRGARAIILSGGPNSVYDDGAPQPDPAIWSGRHPGPRHLLRRPADGPRARRRRDAGRPARVRPGERDDHRHGRRAVRGPRARAAGLDEPRRLDHAPAGRLPRDRPDRLDARSPASPTPDRNLYGIQFHPEVVHTPRGRDVLRNFVLGIAGATPTWTAANFIDSTVAGIRERVDAHARATGSDGKVICALSGGVDSAVAAALVHRAVGDRLTCIYVDHGLMRKKESELLPGHLRARPRDEPRDGRCARALPGPPGRRRGPRAEAEDHRRRVHPGLRGGGGEARPDRLPDPGHALPGRHRDRPRPRRRPPRRSRPTTTSAGCRRTSASSSSSRCATCSRTRSARSASSSGCPRRWSCASRSPGPGLAIRIIGEVTAERLDTLREADWIVIDEIKAAGLYRSAVADLRDPDAGPLRRGHGRRPDVRQRRRHPRRDHRGRHDRRLGQAALRRPRQDLARIVNEVPGVNRVVYDISSKPPATIEWE